MDSASIDRVFSELKEGLVPLLDQILAAPQPDSSLFKGYYDPDAQKKVQEPLLKVSIRLHSDFPNMMCV